MTKLQDFRRQHPEYNDMDDASLAHALHDKFYRDIPFEQYAASVGLTQQSRPVAQPQQQAAPQQQPAPQRPQPQPESQDLVSQATRWTTGAHGNQSEPEFGGVGVPEHADVHWNGGPLSGALNALPRSVRTWLDATGTSNEIALGSFLNPNAQSQQSVIRHQVPGAEFRQDAHGALEVRLPTDAGKRYQPGQPGDDPSNYGHVGYHGATGPRLVDDPNAPAGHTEWMYLNRPGASTQDAITFAGEGAKYTPASRIGALGVTLPGRALTTGGLSALTRGVTDWASTAFGGDAPHGGDVLSAAAWGAGGQTLGDLFGGGLQIGRQLLRRRAPPVTPPAEPVAATPAVSPETQALQQRVEYHRRIAENEIEQPWARQHHAAEAQKLEAQIAAGAQPTSPQQAAATLAENDTRGALESVNPPQDRTAAYDAADEFGIPLTRGQASGDPRQIAFEQRATRGGASPAAENIMRPFVDRQAGALERAGVRLATRGHEPITSNVEDAGAHFRESMLERRQGMQDLSDAAFDRAERLGALEPIAGQMDDIHTQTGWDGEPVFETAEGSLYKIAPNGRTTRYARSEATLGSNGPVTPNNISERTVYLTPQQMGEIRAAHKAGDYIQTRNDAVTIYRRRPGGDTVQQISGEHPYFSEPRPGLHPLELWGGYDKGFTEARFGGLIHRVGMDAASAPSPSVGALGGARPPESPLATVDRALDEAVINLPEHNLSSTRQARESVRRLSIRAAAGNATLRDVMETRKAVNASWRGAQSSDRHGVGVVRQALDDWTLKTFGKSPGAQSIRAANDIYKEMRNTFGPRSAHDLGGGALEDIMDVDRTGSQIVDAILGSSRPPKSALQAVRRVRQIATQTRQDGRMAKRPTQTEGSLRFNSDDQLPTNELQSLREALMYRMIAPVASRQPGGALPAGTVVTNLRNILDGRSSSLTREMFTENEINAMRRFLATAERLVPPEGTVNHSNSAYEIGRMLASASDSLFDFLHIPSIFLRAPIQAVKGNVAGVVDAHRATRATQRPVLDLNPSSKPSGIVRGGFAARGALEQEDAR